MGWASPKVRKAVIQAGHPSTKKLNITYWLSCNWLPLLLALFMLFMLIPYLASPIVRIIPNAMDDALIAALGAPMVKPLLLLSALLGALVGMILVLFYRRLFHCLREKHIFQMDRAVHGVALIAPWFGLSTQSLFTLLSFMSPIPPYEWGTLVNLFFLFPGLGYIFSSSIGWIFLYHREMRHAGEKILFTRIYGAQQKAFILQLSSYEI